MTRVIALIGDPATVSTFVAACLRPDAPSEAAFADAVGACLRLKRQPLAERVGGASLRAATFSRLAGGSGAAVHDPRTGAFLVLAGTWLADGNLPPAHLLALYLARGPVALANRLEGAWTAVVGDPRDRSLTVITDPVGTQMSFLLLNGDGAFLSSSSLALAALDGAGSPDPVACQELLRTGIVFEDRTLHARVKRLRQGTIHRFQDGAARSKQVWWSPESFCTGALGGMDAVDAFGDALESVIRRAARVAPRLSCDLTGGYDSRAVFAAALSAGVDVEPTVNGAPASPDVVVAREVARAAGREIRHQIPATPSTIDTVREALARTDGEYDCVEYGQILAAHSELAAAHDMSLNGSNGELGRGKQWTFALPAIGTRSSSFVKSLVATKYHDEEATGDVFPGSERLDLAEHFERVVLADFAGLEDLPNTARIDLQYLMRMRTWQARIATSTMQVWRAFSPFMARSVLEVMLTASVPARLCSRLFRRYLWARQRQLAVVPLLRGYAAVPFRPDTAHRFLPGVAHFGGRVVRKLTRATHPAVADLPQHTARQLLLGTPEVNAVLDPGSMRAARLFDPAKLEGFLRDAASPQFAFDGQWRRLLSLECALRAVADARAKRFHRSESQESVGPPPV